MDYLKKAKLFLTEPSKAFDKEKKTRLEEGFKYMLVTGLIVSIISGLITAITTLNVFLVIGAIISVYIGLILANTIGGLWLHLWVYIFGGRKGFAQTLKSVYYGFTPQYLLGWLPIIFFIWSLVLTWMGLTRLQKMSRGQAAGAMIIAVIIPMIVMAVFLVAALTLLGTTMLSGTGSQFMPPF